MDAAVPDAALGTLEQAGMVVFGPFGVAAQLLPETLAYRAIADALPGAGDAVRPRLEHLVVAGTPPGKVYGATLLAKLDADAGRQAWQRLSADPSPVTVGAGCAVFDTTVAEYANRQLNPPEPTPPPRSPRWLWLVPLAWLLVILASYLAYRWRWFA